MLNIFISIIGLAGIIFFGYLVCEIILTKNSFGEKISLGYIIGLGFFTLLLFLINQTGIPLSTLTSFILLTLSNLLLILINLFLKKWRGFSLEKFHTNTLFNLKNFTIIDKLIILSIIFFLFSSILSNLYWPVKDWDALTLYDFRGKVFAETGFINNGFIEVYDLGYPLLTSLAHTWFYLIKYSNPVIIYGLYFVSFVIIFYSLLRRSLPKTYALLFTLALVVSPEIINYSTISYTNLPYTIYISLGFLYLYQYLTNKKTENLWLSSILISLSTWTRSSEPFWITALLIVAVIAIYFKKYLLLIPYFTGILLVRQLWFSFMTEKVDILVKTKSVNPGLYGLMMNNLNKLLPWKISFERMLEVFVFVWKNIFLPYKLLIIIFLLCLLLIYKKRGINFYFFSGLIAGNFILIYFGTLVTSIVFPKWSLIGNSAQRMSQFLVPLILFATAILVYEFANTLLLKQFKMKK